ncbi:LOW QUALITY PROTEIN: ankyrin repeat domain-containing protein 60, partial [Theristicus caerulescens]
QAFPKSQVSRTFPGQEPLRHLPSWPLRTLSVWLHLAGTNEIFSLLRCQMTLKKLKSRFELLTVIPLHFQWLQYLDEADLPDESAFKDNDIVPGGTITMRIWQDGWGHLVAAAAKGETLEPARLGVTEESAGTAPQAELLGAEQKERVAHRAFLALFVASHRGHVETAKFLLRRGADLHSKTPLGRTVLDVAAVAGQRHCAGRRLSSGAGALGPGSKGQSAGSPAGSPARRRGRKQSGGTPVCLQWRKRSPGAVPPAGAVNRALQTSAPTS